MNVRLRLLARVGEHHFAKLFHLGALGSPKCNPSSCLGTEIARKELLLGHYARVKNHFFRNGVRVRVVIHKECGERRCIENFINTENIVVLAHERPLSYRENGKARAKLLTVERDNVVLRVGRVHNLLALPDLFERSNGVAALNCRLKLLRLTVGIHFFFKCRDSFARVPLENVGGAFYKLAILLATNVTRTNTAALLHLIVKALAPLPYIPRKTKLAARDTESFVEKRHNAVNRARTLKWTKILCPVGKARSCKEYSGILLVRDFNIRIALCVLESDIVPRRILLDEGVLECERLNLRVTKNVVKFKNASHHFGGFCILFTVLKILGNAIFQLGRFANVNHLARAVAHNIHSGTKRQAVCLC